MMEEKVRIAENGSPVPVFPGDAITLGDALGWYEAGLWPLNTCEFQTSQPSSNS